MARVVKQPNVEPQPSARGGGRTPAYPIESVDRALRLLILLSEHGALTVSAVASQLGVARSTAHRLLAMLQAYGFVRQDPLTKSYMPGSALLKVGLAAVGSLDLRGVARPHLESLRAEFDETVHLAILDGTSAFFLDCCESTRGLRAGSRVGKGVPAYASSSGKAMLSALSEDELERHLPTRLEPLTRFTIVDRKDLRRELDAVRARGYATGDQQSEEGMSGVGVLIPSGPGVPLAALTISAPLTRLPKRLAEVMARSLRRHAADLAAQLTGVAGASGDPRELGTPGV